MVVAIIVSVAALGFGLYTDVTTNDEVSSLNASLSSSAQISSLQSSIGSLQSVLTAAQLAVAGLQTGMAAEQGTVAGLQSTVTSLQVEVIPLGDRLNSSPTGDAIAIQQLAAEVQNLETTVQILSNELAALTAPSTVPALIEQSESTCSYVCGGMSTFTGTVTITSTSVSTTPVSTVITTGTFPSNGSSGQTVTAFPSDVRAGDMLVVTVQEDDLPLLTVSDSLGTALQLAVRLTTSTCGSPSGYCQDDIYWGVLSSAGADSVTVMEPGLDAAIRVEIREFSGVDGVGNTASCTPMCASAPYPASSILLASAKDGTGPGAGFYGYLYAASKGPISEYQVETSSGTTTFPFATSVTQIEVGVVLFRTPS